MKRLIVCVTIDTEADCDRYWRKREPLRFTSVLEGIPCLLRPIFLKYGVRPVYFVSPDVVNNPGCCAVLKEERGLSSEIGMHIHAEELDAGLKSGPQQRGSFICSDYSDADEFNILREFDRLITANLGVKAESFRAGRFGADIQTIRSISRLGYKVDSSVTPEINWSYKGGPDFRGYNRQPYFIDIEKGLLNEPCLNSEILEVPVSVGRKRLAFFPEKWFFYRWLRPSHMFLFEQKWLVNNFIRKYAGNEAVVLCMMFHSMELIPGASPYVRSYSEQRRYLGKIEGILRYLRDLNAEFMTLRQVCDVYKFSVFSVVNSLTELSSGRE